jgi:hypothetical protein
MIGGQENLLDERLQLGRGEPRELGEDVPELMDLAALDPDPGEDLPNRFAQARIAIHDDQERGG